MAVALRKYRDHDALEYQYSPERFHTDGDQVRADRAGGRAEVFMEAIRSRGGRRR